MSRQLVIPLLMIFLAVAAWAQPPRGTHIDLPEKPKKVPIQISGDKLEMEPNDTYVVTGNVAVEQGSTEITCEKGVYNERTGLAQAIHNVQVNNPKFTVTCKRLDAHTRENFSIFSGNVVINGQNITAYAAKANYYEKEEKLILIGNPRADTKDDPPNTVTGRRIVYWLDDDRAQVLGDVVADIRPKDKILNSTGTHITGEKLMILSDGRYQVDGNLVALRGETTLKADRGIYDDTKEITEAFGNVRVDNPKYVMESGYLKNYGLEDRSISSVSPKITQIVERKAKRKSRILSGDTDDETAELGPSRDKAVLTAIQIEALQGGTHVVARGDAMLKQTPYMGEDETEEVTATSIVTADLMDMFTDEGKMVAKGNVELKGHDITATGDRAIYFEEKDDRQEELRIMGNARASQQKPDQDKPNVAVGEEIHYFPARDKVIIFQARVDAYRSATKNELPEIIDTDEVELKRNDKKSSGTGEVSLTTGEVSLGSGEVRLGSDEVNLQTEMANGTGEVKVTPPVRAPRKRQKMILR